MRPWRPCIGFSHDQRDPCLTDQIIQGDAVEVMRRIPDRTFDFCFADPPYFLQIKEGKKLFRVEGTEFDGCDDDWDKFPSMQAYADWTREWLREVRRVLKDNGTVCVISGMQSIHEIGSILRELGFWVINDIIWQKSNPTPNFGGTRLNNSHETIIWAARSRKSRFTFHYKTGKHLNGGRQMGSVWTFPVCSGNERLKDGNGAKLHSTQKPEALLRRIILLFTKKGDLVLDPFGGTMTTAAAARRAGRNYTMIERDAEYIKYGRERLDAVVPQTGDVEDAVFDIRPARVTVAEMVAAGYLNIGEAFFHANGESAVLVNDKGLLRYGLLTASMHEIAARMMGRARRVNAFDHLYVLRDGKKVPLADVREAYRKALAR